MLNLKLSLMVATSVARVNCPGTCNAISTELRPHAQAAASALHLQQGLLLFSLNQDPLTSVEKGETLFKVSRQISAGRLR